MRSTQHRGSSEGLCLALPLIDKCETRPQSGESGPALCQQCNSGIATVGYLEGIAYQLLLHPLHKRILLLFLMGLKRTAPVSIA